MMTFGTDQPLVGSRSSAVANAIGPPGECRFGGTICPGIVRASGGRSVGPGQHSAFYRSKSAQLPSRSTSTAPSNQPATAALVAGQFHNRNLKLDLNRSETSAKVD